MDGGGELANACPAEWKERGARGVGGSGCRQNSSVTGGKPRGYGVSGRYGRSAVGGQWRDCGRSVGRSFGFDCPQQRKSWQRNRLKVSIAHARFFEAAAKATTNRCMHSYLFQYD